MPLWFLIHTGKLGRLRRTTKRKDLHQHGKTLRMANKPPVALWIQKSQLAVDMRWFFSKQFNYCYIHASLSLSKCFIPLSFWALALYVKGYPDNWFNKPSVCQTKYASNKLTIPFDTRMNFPQLAQIELAVKFLTTISKWVCGKVFKPIVVTHEFVCY